ncbi:DNA-protecting protein DprA [Thauera sp. CAU 1555]|uniref:DNA-protecting protein DprA n=1 Tax=Thauera sedimentorum TaxID=2767595 RepID=A0ABR9BC51_9RHOO|nr:DNA-processing protein DprA [Thauera sedimentorum]MBC9072883.1 DNA-protecting protein DprA [Thauera sedimentorum]MBD8503802.1 DNA-protecting protein DprA [Thauera sedimentorum]
MTPQPDLAAWLRLTLTPGVGPERQRRLLAAFGLPDSIFAAGRSALIAVVGRDIADALLAPPDQAAIDATLAWALEPGNHVLTLADAAYPRSLLDTADPPVLLYAKGEPALLTRPALALVGARSATAQGQDNARAFARALAEAGFAIVSGLALGIDAAAHRGALEAADGATVAVIGTGADRIYPARNQALARAIAERGLILSEFPLGTPPLPHNFPRRNRLIAGLARGVLVVEAALGSGSLITARLAAEGGREVFAIPGSIHSPLSRGCHRLIRDGAKLVETAADILEELHWGTPTNPAPGEPPPAAETPAAAADDPAAALLVHLGHDPVDLDTLAARSGLTVDALYAILLPMELDGRIARLPGGRFQRR